ncbi:MAG: CNNM domain-containing protein, partial [Vicinamibacteria bacterium]
MSPEIVAALIVLLCVLAEGFFAGSEIAIISVDKFAIRHLARSGSRLARGVLEILEKPGRFFSTTLVGTNVSVVIGTTVATLYLKD